MKIKILMFPFCLVVSFIILTMYAKPEFSISNQTRAAIKNREVTLNDIRQRNERIENLVKNLEANSDKESLILRFLPNLKEEELIVNSAFQSAVNSSLYMANLGMSYEKKPFNISSQFQNFLPVEAGGLSVETVDPLLQIGPSNIEIINAKFSVVGTYENIKSFLNQIFTMEKENSISSVKIAKSQTAGEGQSGEGTNVNNLNAEIAVYFDNIPSLKLRKDASHPAFSQNSFDFSVASDLEELFNKKVPSLDSGTISKSNPFLP